MHPRLRSPLLATLAVSALIFAGELGLRTAGALEALGLAAYDWHILLRPASQRPAPPVVLVTVTEEDIQRLGTWPLTDDVLASVIENLSRAGARVIGLDIYRDVPVPPGHERLNAVLGAHPQVIGAMKFPSVDRPGVPAPPVLRGTEQVGFTDLPVDHDGTVRRGLLFLDDGQTVFQSLALRVASLYFQAAGVPVSADPTHPTRIRFGRTTMRPFEPNDGSYVRADAGGYQFLIDYRDPPNAFPAVTLDELLAGRVDPALMRDRVVLVGVTAESVKDSFYTPYNQTLGEKRPMYGVAVHAHIVSQLLRTGIHGDAPVKVISDIAESLWILLWCLLGGVVAYTARSTLLFVLTVAGGIALLIVGVHALFALGWWIPLAPPVLGWVGAAGLATAYLEIREKRERAQLMSLFSSYTSAQIADTIWRDRDQFLSGGHPRPQKLTATAFFTDIASFTAVAGKLDAQVLMDWLSEFMELVSSIVGDHGGVILRFIGDSIMAVFGVPIARGSEDEIRQDARNAVSCALEIQHRLTIHNRSLEQRGLPLISMRIGILTGPMVAGSIGSEKRLEYDVHGDTVNTASRLESFDKEGFVADYFRAPCRILIGESTMRLIGDEFRIELMAEERLKGKEDAVRIYRVHGLIGAADAPPKGEAANKSALV
jgi:adenylate cyclase